MSDLRYANVCSITFLVLHDLLTITFMSYQRSCVALANHNMNNNKIESRTSLDFVMIIGNAWLLIP